MPTSAGAAPERQAAATSAEPCLPGDGVDARRDGFNRDSGFSAAAAAGLERDLVARTTAATGARRAGPSTAEIVARQVRIPVRVHVIKPRSGAKTPMTKAKVKRQISIMNKAFAGRQSSASADARIRFVLKGIDYTANRAWYDADYRTAAAKQMAARLHRGDARTLNLYFSSPKSNVGKTLGWSTFPQRAARAPRSDGVVINIDAVPGGRYTGYNRGDTAVHEVGHWLGLFHTFQGGCSARNDYVSDTPAERTPSFTCPQGRDTCPAPGADPIHNFMDYSYDTCMNQFTAGQVERMKLAWYAYRR
ncbi:MAG: zinc metalloprotease [Nocardioidaceae bacterium]|nr:zinc metalloprotease [Nocardioidaceae bacterium]